MERHKIGNHNSSKVLVQQQTVDKMQVPTTHQRNMRATSLILYKVE
jgi:hypothetical protein